MFKICFWGISVILLIIGCVLCKYPMVVGLPLGRYFSPAPEDVRLIFTPEYDEQTANFHVSLPEAAERALRFEKERYHQDLEHGNAPSGFAAKYENIGIHYCTKGKTGTFS